MNYAIALADNYDLGIGDWPVPWQVGPEVEMESGLTPEEQVSLTDAVKRHVDHWVRTGGKAA